MKKACNFLVETLLKDSCSIGEILIAPNFSLRHVDDRDLSDDRLNFYYAPEDARQIARYDDQKNYRSLKTAPNLIRGWILYLKNVEEVVRALDFFYPAALNLYSAFLEKKLETTCLRETLNRQTGMYRITQQLRDDQAQELMSSFCSGCLRKILWSISHEQKITSLSEKKITSKEIPLLCREACNLFVAAARAKLKG